MKRIMSVILAVAMLSVLALMPVSAANEYAISIDNTATEVTVGDTFDVSITIDNVATGTEISYIEFYVSFDATLLKSEYVQNSTGDSTRFAATPGNTEWEYMIGAAEGNYYSALAPVDTGWNETDGVTDSAVSKGDVLTFTLPFTVLDAADGEKVSVTVKDIVAYDANDTSFANALEASNVVYTFTANSKTLPVTTIGAKINTAAPALRLGAQYDAAQLGDITPNRVEDVGIVFYPTRLLNGAELDLNTNGAMKLSAQGIEGYIEGNKFQDYDSFIFYVTIVNIPANGMDDFISYRSYLKVLDDFGGDLFLAENTYERSYNYVYDALYPSFGSGSGDNVVLPDNDWFE